MTAPSWLATASSHFRTGATFSARARVTRQALTAILLFIAYFLAGKLGLRLAFVNASATAVWPPTGIALASLLILGYEFWPVIFLGAFAVNITTAGGAATSAAIAFGNTLEAILAAYMVKPLAGGRFGMLRAANVFNFALCPLVATAGSATIGVISLCAGHLAPWTDYANIWLTWWLGDSTGAIIFAPSILLWSAPAGTRPNR